LSVGATSPNGIAMAELETRIARLKFRAWHRGTREADFLIGGFFDRHHRSWGEAEIAWFEDLLEQEDADVMAWAMGTQAVPDRFAGAQMTAMQKLDYVEIPR
jgi:antitoxin CptB